MILPSYLSKAYRRQQRIIKNSLRLEKEKSFYHSLFLQNRLVIPSETDLENFFRGKYPKIAKSPVGTLGIASIFQHHNWENEALLPSLKKIGPVHHFDQFAELDLKKSNYQKVKRAVNTSLLNWIKPLIKNKLVDVIFCYLSGEQLFPETVEELTTMGVPSVNMYLNDKESFIGRIKNKQAMGSRDICRYFDLSWSSTEDALEKYCVAGARPIYLPEGANPEVHKPYNQEKTIDVSFVGQCYGSRPEIIHKLRVSGIDAVAYGAGWPNGPLATVEMVKLYSKSKINIGFAGVDGLTNAHCLKGRDFEVPMSGGLYLTEYNKELESVYRLGEEILTYETIDDLIGIIKVLLANPALANRIRQNGMRRARSEHTWEKRFHKIFSLMGLFR